MKENRRDPLIATMMKFMVILFLLFTSTYTWSQTCTLTSSTNWNNASPPTCQEGGNAGTASVIVIPSGITLTFDNATDTWTGSRIEVRGTLNIAAVVQINATIDVLNGGSVIVADNAQLNIGDATNDPCPYTLHVATGGVVDFTGTSETERLRICGITIATLSGGTCNTFPDGPIPYCEPATAFQGPFVLNETGLTLGISDFSPGSGAVGATVQINGSGFSTTPEDNTVAFNGINAVVTNATQFTLTTSVPSSATTGPISVTVAAETVNSQNDFTVLPTPAIDDISPESGAIGAVIVISGSNFSPTPANNTVQFNGVQAFVSASTSTSITTVVPAGATTGPITVTVAGTGVTVSSPVNFTVLPTPTITGFTPTSGAVNATVTINGTNFSTLPAENIVRFNGTLATVTASTSSSITATVPAGATTGFISVTTSGVTVSSATSFTVLPTPTFTSFSPTSGAVGATIILTGTNFGANPIVHFFNTINAEVSASSPTSITVTVPPGAITGPISVTSSGVTVTSLSNFTVLPTPTLTGFNPVSGSEGATVTITGTNFSTTPANNVVRFNGTLATVTAATTTSLTTSVPAGATSGPISVTVSGITLTSAEPFTVVPTPTISGFSPGSGAVSASVVITGTNFSTTPANNVVRFNGTLATVTAATATSLTTSVPAGATSGPISVSVNGTGVTITSASNFTVLPTPTITTFTPTSGSFSASVTISGTNFSTTPSNNVVRFNGTLATVTAATSSSLTTTVPAGATTGPISVTTSGVTITSASSFTVLPTPVISGIAPEAASVGATVVISGANFSTTPDNNVVRFNGTLATVTASTTTSITAIVPFGASSGFVSLEVSGTGVIIFSPSEFTVLPSPTITGFSPTSGAVTAAVLISGTNFSTTPANNVVRFNGVQAVVTASTATSITTSVPAGATTGLISVEVSGTGITVSSSSNFTVLPTPTITSFSPTGGAETATVIINGTNFSTIPANNVVRFNGVLAVVTTSTTTSITTSVPAGATTGPISLAVSGTGITVNSSSNFTVLPTPTITSFSPESGAVTARVVIRGTNFSNQPSNNVVRFNGTLAIVTASNPNRITTSVPAGATTGPISVTLNGVTINTATNFTVLPTPTLSGFSPVSGSEGATVTITGTNFSTTPENNEVTFNGTEAIVTASTATSITTSVPVGATSGPISITVSGITLTSAEPFTVVPTPTISGFSPGSGAVSASVVITGTNFSTTPANNVVRFNGTLATVTSASATSLTTSVPAGATSGPISVSVNGTGVTITSASNFTVLPTPTITTFTPTSGSFSASVTISGTNFSTTPSNNVVRFNGTLATVTAATSSSLTTTVPAGATTGPINVTTSGVTITSASSFTVLPTPVISGIAPVAASVGATVVISGANFSTTPDNNVVRFNGTLATVTASTATGITAIVPFGASSGFVSVEVSGTGVIVSSPSEFTVLPSPTITGFNPTSGAVTATVTISGTNFSTTPANNVVRFNGVQAVVTASTATSITTSVPAGATTGLISVEVSGTGITVSSSSNFTVLPTPTITSFSPTGGAETATVIINGTNFSTIPANNVVRFNGVLAVVTTSTTTSITTSVPAGATTGPISLVVSGTGITVNSSSNFTVLPTPTITSFSPESGAVTATVIISGTNFSNLPANNVVRFNGTLATVTASTPTSLTTSVPAGATTGPLSVTTSGVTISSATNFTVAPTPTFTGFTPASGVEGTTVTLSGTNFNTTPSDNSVFFNGVQAVVTASTPTTLTTVVPVGALSGPISVIVNGITLTSASSFTVLPSPTITGFDPTSGAVSATVVITGTNFSTTPSNNVVRFNGTLATVTSASSTSLTTTVPAGATSGPISVTISGTGVTITSNSNFTVLSTPTLTGFTPTSGAIGASVTIFGTNFSTTPSSNVVRFNGVQAVVTNSTTSTLTTSVPVGATTGPLSVTVSGITLTGSIFTVLPSPTITGFNPSTGAAGAAVTISGTNFSTTPTNNVVEFNGTNAVATGSTQTSITTTVPAGATTGPISVTVSGVTVTSVNDFFVPGTPTIISFSPTSGAISATVVISGTNFSPTPSENIVRFNGVLAIVTASTSNSITVIVPNGATTGPISITVSGVSITSASNFTVLGTPTLTGFSPSSGAIGATITISGTNFSTTPSNNEVMFNGIQAVVTNSSTISITAIVPDGATTGPISVTVSGVTVTSAVSFTVVPSPAITGFDPTSGTVGAAVSISGLNFNTTPTNNVVRFNGTLATVTASTSTSITTTVPSGATSGPVSVTVSGVTVVSGASFTVLASPTITGFTPSSGAVTATVTISGTNFSSTPANNEVRFNGVLASVISSTPTSITTTVPLSATTGPITVRTSGVTITSAANFTVLGTPSITGFTPTSGAITAEVILSGLNFSTTPVNNEVRFNGALATVTASTTTSVTVTVPTGATTGPITVRTAGITATSSESFTVLPSPTLTGFDPTSGARSATVTIFGTNFSATPANNVVRFNGIQAIASASSPTSITTTVPSGATTGPISVTVNGVTVTNAAIFTVLPTPTISGFNPTSGAETATVTINGTNFSTIPSNNVVEFNGTDAVVTGSTSTSITTRVPSGATSGPITVTVSGVTISSATNFTVRPTPVITNFDPKFGPVGTTITITGENFSATPTNNIVRFNGIQAAIISSTETSIIVNVPLGTSTGPICVTTSGVTVCSTTNFIFGEINPDDTTPPILQANNTPTSVTIGSNIIVSAQFIDPESSISNVSLQYRTTDGETTLTNTNMIQVGNSYEFTIPASALGELGIIYKFRAVNGVGLEYTSPDFLSVAVNHPAGLTIPYTSFGKSISSYEIFSIPLNLDNKTVSAVLNELMPYDNSKWRISTYQNTSNTNLELTMDDQLQPGKGYWLIIKDNPGLPLNTGSGKTVQAEPPFAVQLQAGWNQIGNPYPFDLDWSEIVAANPGLSLSFRTYNGAIKNFENSTTLPFMRGGFVNVAANTTLVFPPVNTSSGRLKGSEPLTNSIDQSDWEVNFEIHQRDLRNVIGGIGMRHNASENFDPYDGFSMPQMEEYLDLNHTKKLNGYAYSKDIIPSTANHTWEFTVDASDKNSVAVLRWDNRYFGENEFMLVLYDKTANIWVDMRKFNSYNFTPSTSFTVLYGKEQEIQRELSDNVGKIVQVSPNPIDGSTTIYVSIPVHVNQTPVHIDLVSVNGQKVTTVFEGVIPFGYQKIEWSGNDAFGERPVPGLYILRMHHQNRISTYKVIIK